MKVIFHVLVIVLAVGDREQGVALASKCLTHYQCLHTVCPDSYTGRCLRGACACGTEKQVRKSANWHFTLFQSEPFTAANQTCTQHHMRLVRIDSLAKYEIVRDFIRKHNPHHEDHWTDIISTPHNDHKYIHADGTQAKYLHWHRREPDDQDTAHCVRLKHPVHDMATSICKHPLAFVCERGDVDGGWSGWSSWGTCSSTCGDGTMQRSRFCNAPTPVNNGAKCAGQELESKVCRGLHATCQVDVDGAWSTWSSWSTCSSSCGVGITLRNRTCSNPVPKNNGAMCLGDHRQTQACRGQICPDTTASPIWISVPFG